MGKYTPPLATGFHRSCEHSPCSTSIKGNNAVSKKTYIAYQITETGKTNKYGDPIIYWNRIGAGWENKAGSIKWQPRANHTEC
jgi:hypothetical protein